MRDSSQDGIFADLSGRPEVLSTEAMLRDLMQTSSSQDKVENAEVAHHEARDSAHGLADFDDEDDPLGSPRTPRPVAWFVGSDGVSGPDVKGGSRKR